MVVEFHNNSLAVKAALDTKTEQFLEEAASEIESAARRNSRVASAQLKGSWAHIVDGKTATIGSPSRMQSGKNVEPVNMRQARTAGKAAGCITTHCTTNSALPAARSRTRRCRKLSTAAKRPLSTGQNNFSGSWANDKQCA